MKHIWVVFRKEMLYTLRDKRTLAVMVIIPLLLFPSIFVITGSIQKSVMEGEAGRKLKVAFLDNNEAPGLLALFMADTTMKVSMQPDTTHFREWLRADSFDLAVAVGSGFKTAQAELKTGEVMIWYDQTKEFPYERAKLKTTLFQEIQMRSRMDSLGITKEQIEPVKVTKKNTASTKETIGKLAGGFLPYIFIAFCYMGCMFPAIDLFTGEKERGTIETILATPVDRWKLMAGKMLVMLCSGMTTASLALFGMFVGLQLAGTLPQEIMDIVLSILTPGFVLAFLMLLLPMVAFFSGIMVPATVYAKSYKEAQSILSPLNFLVIMPAIVGMMPGVELNYGTAFVPVLNVVLATKDLIAGTLDPILFVIAFLSLVSVAAISLVVSFRRFGNEKNILRT